MTEKIYDQINNRVIELLEKGVAPWRQPWKANAVKPAMNLISKRHYTGCNFFLVNCQGYTSPYWATFKQYQNKGATVKKGEKGTPIVFYKPLAIKEKQENGDIKDKTIPLIRLSYVFNSQQVEGLTLKEDSQELKPCNPIESCQNLISKFPLGMPEIRHNEARAFYNFNLDYINLPKMEMYNESEEYYQTLFHECLHATGHEKRLHRATLQNIHCFGDESYSQEELIAELGASYLAAFAGIDSVTIENSASYLSNWLNVLRKDNKFLLKASAQAQKAVDYLIGKQQEASEED
jgi:antirestriction protein ArdC